MSFYEKYTHYSSFDFAGYLEKVSSNDIVRILEKETLSEFDFLALLSEAAVPHLETMARKAKQLTEQHFGKVISLYAPLYLSNICDNECIYCGFKHSNPIERKRLSAAEAEREAQLVAASGIRNILLLTGESSVASPVGYIKECAEAVRKHFSTVSIEVYPLETKDYAALASSGVDGLTLYQETYNETLYKELHVKGPKSDYRYRLDAPERGCRAHFRFVGIGALLGLDDYRRDAFFTGLHAAYLQNKYLDTEISVSLPRIQPQVGNFRPRSEVTDLAFVQLMLAFRLFMPRAGITVSTREKRAFRRNLIGLGVTRMSAGSRTDVGGYSGVATEGQFTVADASSVEEVAKMIAERNYQPVLKDWQTL